MKEIMMAKPKFEIGQKVVLCKGGKYDGIVGVVRDYDIDKGKTIDGKPYARVKDYIVDFHPVDYGWYKSYQLKPFDGKNGVHPFNGGVIKGLYQLGDFADFRPENAKTTIHCKHCDAKQTVDFGNGLIQNPTDKVQIKCVCGESITVGVNVRLRYVVSYEEVCDE